LLWVADRLVESGALKPYNRFRRLGSGGLDLESVGTSLATFALPEFTVGSVLDLPVGKSIYWDSTLFVGGGYAYVYGNSSCLDGLTFGHVARAPVGSLGRSWQYRTGSGWSASESGAARLIADRARGTPKSRPARGERPTVV
jgi:hypothetical protein